MHPRLAYLGGLALALGSIVACSGGGGSGGGYHPPTMSPTAPATSPPTAAPQVVDVELPQNGIGQENDPTFGLIGGYSQTQFSQTLGFVPGAQIMIKNVDPSGIPHTLGDIGTQSFPSGQPASLSFTKTNSNTFSAGWQSGTINAGQLVGPIALSAGTYYIGCAYHYASNTMRDVLVVAANAKPGPQATPDPAQSAPPTSPPGGY
ncbi:MAG: hypothetical protein ACREM2_09350 [Vulcanimicrobiaceae bacterium]